MLDVSFNKKHVAGVVSAVAAAALAIVARYGTSAETIELIAFAAVLAVAALVDLESFLIPNGCIVAAAAVRTVYIAYAGATGALYGPALLAWSALSAAAVLALLLAIAFAAEKLLGRFGIGGGDLKLFAVCAFYFGFERSLALIVLACAIGLVFALAKPAPEGRSRMDRVFPLGPAIALAAWACMLA